MNDDTSSVKNPRSFGWNWIFKTLLLRKKQAASILALAIIAYAVGLVFPIAAQKIVDEIVDGRANVNTVSWTILALAAIFIEGIVFFLRQKLIIELAVFVDRRVSRRAFTHLMRVRIDGTQFSSGDIINHFQQATKIRDFVLYQIPTLIIDSGGAIIALILAIYYDKVVGLALLICAPLMIIFAGRQVGTARTYSEKFYKSVGKRQNILSETVSSISTIRSLSLETSSLHRWSRATESMLSNLRTVMSLGRNFMLRAQVASRLMTFIVISLGCLRMFYGHLSVGELLALQMLSSRITGPILASGDAYRIWQGVDVAIKQIKNFLSIPIEKSNIKTPIRTLGFGGIKFTNVSIKYPGRQSFALTNVNFELPDKGLIAIVGKNGSGKSTLLRILLGLRRDFTGLVEISNHNIMDYDLRWLRSKIGTVDQETTLFTGTVRENISGNKRQDENFLKDALAFAGALEFVEDLPEGLDYELSENGRSLSGGQRQRLSIARAVIRDPVLAILDEPTAFLDPEAALAMEKNLLSWGRSRLLILVTHHLGAIKEADNILVLDQGYVVGIGRHDELIDQCDVYKSLWSDYDRSSSRG